MKNGTGRGGIALALLAVALVSVAAPRPSSAWRYTLPPVPMPTDHVGYIHVARILLPAPPPRPGYRFSLPPGAPLSLDDPVSGTIYCLSRSAGVYFVCGYTAAPPASALPDVPAPAGIPAAGTAPAAASAILLFTLPAGSAAAVDGVPIGLSDGLGVASVRPGPHQVVLTVPGARREYRIDVSAQRILTITPSAVVQNEP